jgi:hypothetical protein
VRAVLAARSGRGMGSSHSPVRAPRVLTRLKENLDYPERNNSENRIVRR